MKDFDIYITFPWLMFTGILGYSAVLYFLERKSFFMLSIFLIAVFYTCCMLLDRKVEYEDEDVELFQEVSK